MATTPATMTTDVSAEAYIPVGCLVYPSAETPPPELGRLQNLQRLGWIRVEQIHGTDNNITTARFYVLPDDLENARVPRSDTLLRRRRMELLASLDFSADTWNGRGSLHPSQKFPSLSPTARSSLAHDQQDMSLLKMFNSIPSPAPDINTITDSLPRKFMSNLLASTVDGLTTDLYPYQSRSAALMHQRETAPNKYLDPRFHEVLDQNANPYYYDSCTGDLRREPRHYDASRGGILAEEMGSGKTLICLALIAATKDQPAQVPDLYQGSNVTIRPRIGSLMDMAAAVATKNSCPWRIYLDPSYEYCIGAIKRNPGWYYVPRPQSRRLSRINQADCPPYKIYLSQATLVVVPTNLLEQWVQEISKHTRGLKVHIIESGKGYVARLPSELDLLQYDIILCSVQALEALWQDLRRPEHDGSWTLNCAFGRIRYKRCIVDEGHKLGNSGLASVKTSLILALNALHISARWVVTGTPSKGLFGVEEESGDARTLAASTAKQERQDLERIGSIVTSYLKVRPWSNSIHDYGDTPASWRVYVMQPSHSPQSGSREDCLKFMFDSLIVRHRLSEVSHLLPDVDAKVVRLEGSYQDKLSLNLFSMMIISNAVQSQRIDQDYFFHPRNRKSLLELVNNLRQASFFGGSFFPTEDIQKAVQTAEEFLEKKSVSIDATDDQLLRSAIAFGQVAAQNRIKHLANKFHEMPIYVRHFPDGAGSAWSMDGKDETDLICTHYEMMLAAQRLLRPFLDSPSDLNTYLNSGAFAAVGNEKRECEIPQALPKGQTKASAGTTLAGNTKLGEDRHPHRKRHSTAIKVDTTPECIPTPPDTPDASVEIAAPLADTQLVSTTSAKLSYLIDAIIKYQKDEQIIIFYENDNVAWYLAGILDMLQVQHLIYAKTISSVRRAQYVSTFNRSTKFRVLFMDLSQAAFGLDMRSASRIYFINPVHNPQIEAQAIGRVRRISQKKKVTVETLVLKDSLEEVIVERKHSMTQAEHRNCKTILDDRPIYEWILNPKIIPLPDVHIDDGPSQMARLAGPQYIFGREFGRERSHPDEDILVDTPSIVAAVASKEKQPAGEEKPSDARPPAAPRTKFGRVTKVRFQSPSSSSAESSVPSPLIQPGKRARFADDAGEGSGAKVPSTSESLEPPPARSSKRIRFVDDTDSGNVDASEISSASAA